MSSIFCSRARYCLAPCLLLLSLLLAAQALVGAEEAAGAESAAALLRGRIEGDASGLRISVARDLVEDRSLPEGELALVSVAEDGSFQVPLPDADGRYALTVIDSEDRVLWGRSHVRIGDSSLNIELPERDGSLEGLVLDPTGQALVGVGVQMWRRHSNSCRHYTLSHTMISEEDGGFLFDDLAHGSWDVLLEHPDWAPVRRSVEISSDMAIVELQAQPGGQIRGQVLRPDGSAIAGARVGDRRQRNSETDAEGRFHLRSLPEGRIRLFVDAEGFALPGNQAHSQELALGEEAEVTLRLQPTGTIAALIRRSDGSDAPQELRARLRTRHGGYPWQTLPVEDHSLLWENIAVGTYTLDVQAAGTGTAEVQVTVQAGEESMVELLLPKVWSVQAQVQIPQGLSMEDLQIRAFQVRRDEANRHSSRSGLRTMRQEADGRIYWDAVEEGIIEIDVSAPGHIRWQKEVSIGGEEQVPLIHIALERGSSLRASVSDSEGRPLSGIRVRAIAEQGQGNRHWLNAETDSSGLAVVDGLAPGISVEVRVEDDQWMPHTTTVVLEAQPQDHEIDIVLQRGLEINGRVLSSTGDPVAEAWVWAWHRSHGHRSTRSDATGRFTLAGLAEGEWHIQVEAEDNARVDGRARAGSSDVELRLPATMEQVVEVLRSDGSPLANHLLHYGTSQHGRYQELTTDESGQARFTLLPEDHWWVQVRAESHALVLQRGQAPISGPPPPLRIQLSSGHEISGLISSPEPLPEGLRVTLYHAHNQSGQLSASSVAEDGSFTLRHVPDGILRAQLELPESEGSYLTEVILVGDEMPPVHLDWQIPATGAIKGRLPRDILTADSEQEEGQTVVIFNAIGSELNVQSDSSGNFSLPTLPAGPYQMRLLQEDGVTAWYHPFTVRAGETLTIDVFPPINEPGFEVSGQVIYESEKSIGHQGMMLFPDLGREASIEEFSTQRLWPQTEIDEQGQFHLQDVRAGSYWMMIYLIDAEQQPIGQWVEAITVSENRSDLRIHISDRPMPMIRVVDSAGEGIENVQVTVMPQGIPQIQRWAMIIQGLTDQRGHSRLAWLSHEYPSSLLLYHQEKGFLAREGLSREDLVGETIVLEMGETMTLSGHVQAPLSAQVTVTASTLDGSLFRNTSTDSQGSWQIEGLHPGSYDLWLHAPGLATQHQRIDLQADNPPIPFEHQLSASGDLLIEYREGDATGREIRIFDEAGEEIIRPRNFWRQHSFPLLAIWPFREHGILRIRDLAPGTYRVQVGSLEAQAEVQAGKAPSISVPSTEEAP